MNKKYWILRFLILGLFNLMAMQAAAIDERYAALPLTGNKLATDSSNLVQDTVFFNLALRPTQTTFSVQNIITLKINEFSTIALPDTFVVTVRYKVYFSKYVGGSVVLDSSSTQSQLIEYNKFRNYRSQNVYAFSGGYKSQVKIISVIPSSSSGTFADYRDAIMLENEIIVTREYDFNPNTDVVETISGVLGSSEDEDKCSSTSEFMVSWAKVNVADEYDLEWAYIDSSAIANYCFPSTTDIDPRKLFLNNATRVSIARENYQIPILYENGGILFYRVRTVRIKQSGQRIEGLWSSSFSGGLGSYGFSGHELSLNWQASTSYAEEGKRKSVVQYFDGTLRNRQTVTKDNTTCYTIVAETLYDYQGRPVIQVMPAPTLSGLLGFTPGFSTYSGGGDYDKEIYDSDTTGGVNNCNAVLPGMDSLTGASRYYSPSNEKVNSGFHKYIPDAKLYPFAETRYTSDNTGRITMQGGVGKDFQINQLDPESHSHETRYFYGGADQEELDALFGTEAGAASHYFKNMVRDANGQYSVSYVDMHGRTVATALAGKPESKMDSLLSSNQKTIVKKLLDSSNNLVVGTSIISTKSLIVTSAGSHRFEYSVSPTELSIDDCDSTAVCYDCLYDLEITISNDCSNPGNEPIVIRRTNYDPLVMDTICTVLGLPPSVDTSIVLTEGSYTITKNLSINQSGFDKYREIFIRRNLCKSLQEFIDEQQQIFLTGIECYPDCQTCLDSLGTWTTYRSKYMSNNHIPIADSASFREQAWLAFLEQTATCDDLCKNTGIHTSIRHQMLIDMTAPYGQYAEIDSAYDPHNIFYTASGIQNLRFKQLTSGAYYKNEYGLPDSIINSAGIKVPPHHASVTKEEFLENFKSTWPETLLELHPEYCKLLKTESYSASHIWDENFGKIETYQQALDSGYLNPTAFSGVPATSIFTAPATDRRDPFFTVLETGLEPAFEDSLLNFVKTTSPQTSAWALATIMAHCGTGDEACFEEFQVIDSAFKIYGCNGELDFAWRYFREMYLYKKMQIVEKVIRNSCSAVSVLPWHTLSFPDIDPLDGTHGFPDNTTGATDSLNNFIDANCKAYVQQWLEEMQPCNLDSSDSLFIIPRLIAVCKAGGDETHIFGSSTAKPGTVSSYGHSTFMEVLQAAPGITYDSTCNAFLITAPKPYDKQPAYSDIEIWDTPDSCQCEKLSSMYQDFKLTDQDANFAAYVLRKTGAVISQGTLDTLMSLCTGIISCKFLEQPVIIPAVLQCNTQSNCISCYEIKDRYADFKTDFPGSIPVISPQDSGEIRTNQLFEKYMNYHFGFIKSADEYLAFMDTCNIDVLPDSTGCDSLQILLTTFQETIYNQDTAIIGLGGCDISKNKISLVGDFNHTSSVNLADWMYNGVLKTPYNDSTSYTPNLIYADTLCFDSLMVVESRVRAPYSEKGFNWFVNGGNSAPLYNTTPIIYYFDNKAVYFWLVYGNKLKSSYPSLNDSIYGTVQIFESGILSAEHLLFPIGRKDIGEWVTLKALFNDNYAEFKINNNLVDTIHYTTPPNKFLSFVVKPNGFDFQMDWLKMYDNQQRLRYFEDYLGCPYFAKQTMSDCLPDCKEQFVSYFNSIQSTSYTFSQIDSLYFAVCGIHPDPCYSNPIDCKQLEQALIEYNLLLYAWQRSYDSLGLEKNVWNWSGNYINKTNPSIYNYYFKDFFRNSMLSSPDTISVSADPGDFSYTYNIPMCTGNEFTFSARLRIKPGLDPVLGQEMFNIYTDKGLMLPMFTGNSGYSGFQGGYIDFNGAFHSIFDFSSHWTMYTLFSDWKDLKVTFKDNKVWVYINDTLRGSIFYPGNFYKFQGFGISGWYGSKLEYDWIKIYDGTGNLQMHEEFIDPTNFIKPSLKFVCPSNDCIYNFTSFFNSRYNTSYVYSEIMDIYKSKCQVNFEPCGPVSGPILCGNVEPVFPSVSPPDLTPCADSTLFSVATGTLLYQAYYDSLINSFNDRYIEKCLGQRYTEEFTVTAPISEFHYTLYYYDQAGNLVKTIPPAGVNVSKFDWIEDWSDSVTIARANHSFLIPTHTLSSQYRYNTLNQVVAQSTPDAGISKFWYDRLGRLVISQNAVQKELDSQRDNLYSYTKYDYLGRIAEVGQIRNHIEEDSITNLLTRHQSSLLSWFSARDTYRSQITNTYYDTKYAGFVGFETSTLGQTNLRNRVSYTSITDSANLGSYNQATFYSYDIHGNVDTLLQDYGNSSVTGLANMINVQTTKDNRWKRLVYQYDLISGKVNHVAYQPPRGTTYYADMFYHKYSYDAENRLILVETSMDSLIWEKEARYDYYRHGPLARAVIGEQLVQGIDYSYTLQGWMKGVNAISLLNATNDPGGDGNVSGANQYIARDAMSFNLNYFAGDYLPINATVSPFPSVSTYLSTGDYKPLYNGNISSMAVNIKYPSPTAQQVPQLYNYTYDQLNRITKMDVYRGLNESGNTWSGITATNDYIERIAYDANGNILKYLRNGTSATNVKMDSLSYKYYPNTNRLKYVKDSVGSSYLEDIHNQTNTNNYKYDHIGNLVSDTSEGITAIKWNVYGKIKEIQRTATDINYITNIQYTYDASGNRISKRVFKSSADSIEYTWYVRDESGNVMATYIGKGPGNGTISAATSKFKLTEQHLYGSSRIGILNRNINANGSFVKPVTVNFIRGDKSYELSNYLGNVLVTISDKKAAVDSGPNGTIDYYNADIVTANDYFPGGMMIPGRKYQQGSIFYRYGFNGQEKSNEIKGEGNSYAAEFWEYDPRLVRRWNIDPVKKEDESPYMCFSGNPIWNIDPHGDNDTTATSLNTGQFADAIKIGYNEVANNIKTNTLSHNKKGQDRMLASIETFVDNYATANNLTFEQGMDMQKVATSYFWQFFAVADWSKRSFIGIADMLNSNKITDNWKIGISNYVINMHSHKWGLFWSMVESTVYTVASGGYVGSRNIGAGPKGAFKSNTQKEIVESQAGVRFTETSIQRYVNPGRTVSSSDLRRAINGKAFPDPQGSGASAYYTTVLRNGKSYNLKVIYNKESNTIFHFHYSRQAMGPLTKIQK